MSAVARMTPRQPMRVLVVDDDPDMLQLLTATLEGAFGDEVRVESFGRPEEALVRLEGNVIDVLITDLQMPGMNGLQLLRCAKRRNVWTQVVVVTGHGEFESLADAMDLGASDYLVKPLDPVELQQTLRETSSRFRRWRHSLASSLAHEAAV